MEKKKYQKPLINVVAIDAVGIMAGWVAWIVWVERNYSNWQYRIGRTTEA